MDPKTTFASRFGALVSLTFNTQLQACYEWKMSSTSQLYRYTHGNGYPGAEVLARVAEFGFNINWLLLGEGPMFAATPAGQELRKRIAVRILKKEVTVTVDDDLMTDDLRSALDAERAHVGEFTDTGALLPVGKSAPIRKARGGAKAEKE
ncbi:MAG: helix-turn-helix transcriptional regulator [Bacteroidetes bacterium]|nr:helix-turn-helix transcriptional regulator [Bacteroidota bacterium]